MSGELKMRREWKVNVKVKAKAKVNSSFSVNLDVSKQNVDNVDYHRRETYLRSLFLSKVVVYT